MTAAAARPANDQLPVVSSVNTSEQGSSPECSAVMAASQSMAAMGAPQLVPCWMNLLVKSSRRRKASALVHRCSVEGLFRKRTCLDRQGNGLVPKMLPGHSAVPVWAIGAAVSRARLMKPSQQDP